MRQLITLIFGIFFASSVLADVAKLQILGFSEDGSLFGFQQSGVLGGSGFAYAELHLISTITGKHVADGPFRLEDQSGHKTPKQISEDILQEDGLGHHSISNVNTTVLAKRFSTDVSSSPNELEFHLSENALIQGEVPHSVIIRPHLLPASESCASLVTEMIGFEVELRGATTTSIDGLPVLVQPLDQWGCAIDYQVSGVYLHEVEGRPHALGAIVRVKLYGFEGPKIRWMGVAFKL